MKIYWRDADFKDHEIDLKHALDVSINGVNIKAGVKSDVRITTQSNIIILPIASNSVIIANADE